MSYTASYSLSSHYAPPPAYTSTYAGYPGPAAIPAKKQLDYKVQLRARLAQCSLSSMPSGFPFSTSCSHVSLRDIPNLSCESFEFNESLPDGAQATIRFVPPNPVKTKYFSWRAYVPTHSDGYPKYAAAEVQVHPGVLGGSYGRQIMKSSVIILRALAVSLELGLMLTIRVANKETVHLRRHASASSVRLGDVVFIGTDNTGRQEVVFNASAGDL